MVLMLVACVEGQVGDSVDGGVERVDAPPVVEWATAWMVTGADTTMEVIVSDPDGGEDIDSVVVGWWSDGTLTTEIEQTAPREHEDGRVHFFTRHPTVAPRDSYEVIAFDLAGTESDPYVVTFGSR